MNTKFQSHSDELFQLSSAAAIATAAGMVQSAGTIAGVDGSDASANATSTDLREQQFHDFIREIIVCIFIYFFLYALAYFAIKLLRRSKETDEYVLDYEDAIADRVSIWLCTFTLATCFGAVLLLPMSIVASEVIDVTGPHNSFYWKWLNSSLLHGLWNTIFLFSNLSLFVFLPFAHLFAESIGLPGYRKGIKSRVIETSLILALIAVCMLGISFVVSAVFDSDNAKSHSFLNFSEYHLPFLYSCISFIGVLILLICTPLGFARLFTVVSNLIMKSTFRVDLKEELEAAEFEENCIINRLRHLEQRQATLMESSGNNSANHQSSSSSIMSDHHSAAVADVVARKLDFETQLDQVQTCIRKIKNQSKRSTVYRNLCYPFIMIFLLVLNMFGVLMVAKNTFYVIFGKLPTARLTSNHYAAEKPGRLGTAFANTVTTGVAVSTGSFNSLGILQTAFEILLILYFMIASLVGFYNMPFFHRILPRYKMTSQRTIILNCCIFLVFSSALPVSSKILGLTRFDLLGHFGNLHWLANVHIILIYNFGFAAATGVCLITRLTATVRSELYNRVLILFQNALVGGTGSGGHDVANATVGGGGGCGGGDDGDDSAKKAVAADGATATAGAATADNAKGSANTADSIGSFTYSSLLSSSLSPSLLHGSASAAERTKLA